ncbi:hypothetical protein RB2359 [Rhodopirellula baltica SH 1]|uniref:Uncharacterized protein n=1 Tax=Rhodopirellula baltica (strain DSM 10527 / NCIMB 13988 / SH1) TaxID=243090 RepID=Q7UVZ1_RHOBA|nr:hypothetical protein RB2359 [Rhodopirellula baltica SH 1]
MCGTKLKTASHFLSDTYSSLVTNCIQLGSARPFGLTSLATLPYRLTERLDRKKRITSPLPTP